MDLGGVHRYRICWCFSRRFKHIVAGLPPDVVDAFQKYSGGRAHLTQEQFLAFLKEEQGEIAAETVVEQLMQQKRRRHLVEKLGGNSHGFTLDEFYQYLASPDLNSPISNEVHHDMTKPLSHYYIYSSHNTYLKGNQISSDCSVKPIIKALKMGVRVIELDLWPNSFGNRVLVKHGRTLTRPVDLAKCLRSIKEHAFEASPYPVIITLEDHLTPKLQAKVAKMLAHTFQDMIYCPESEFKESFPSPDDLKHRILISTKPPKEYLTAASSSVVGDNRHLKDSDSDDSTTKGDGLLVKESLREEHHMPMINELSEESDAESSQVGLLKYKNLIAIHSGKPKGGIREALTVDTGKVRRLSLSEPSLEMAAENHGMDMVRFTRKNLLRIYPRGTRLTSSNYRPCIGWMHGVQMVAFNMQGYGSSLWMMHGMFRANGGCGYVKKPDFLCGEEGFDPKLRLPPKLILMVKLYMSDGWQSDFKPTHFDPYSPPDFYARMGIAGAPVDTTMKRTKTKEDRWAPVWGEEFEFPLVYPELALLRFEVYEEDFGVGPDFGGQSCLPVAELRRGIRAVALFNRKGEKYKSVRLIVRFQLLVC